MPETTIKKKDEDKVLTNAEMIDMLTEVTIKKKDKEFIDLRWVLNAIDNDFTRSFVLTHLYVDDNKRAIGCDSMRLNILKECSLKPGFYDILKNTQNVIQLRKLKSDLDYPDVNRVIPDIDESSKMELRVPGKNKQNLSLSYCLASPKVYPDRVLLIDQLKNTLDHNVTMFVYAPDNPKGGQLIFKDENELYFSIVMCASIGSI